MAEAAKKKTTPKPKELTDSQAIKQATELKISTVGDFKKRVQAIVQLPSGLVVKLRNPGGLSAFMGSSTIPNGLMPLVTKQLSKGGTEQDEAKILEEIDKDPQLVLQMSQMMDSVTLKCIVEPTIHEAPESEEDRSDDLLYVDEIDMSDKHYIYNWITSGVTELEPFRK